MILIFYLNVCMNNMEEKIYNERQEAIDNIVSRKINPTLKLHL